LRVDLHHLREPLPRPRRMTASQARAIAVVEATRWDTEDHFGGGRTLKTE
jgi:hypothetical protein